MMASKKPKFETYPYVSAPKPFGEALTKKLKRLINNAAKENLSIIDNEHYDTEREQHVLIRLQQISFDCHSDLQHETQDLTQEEIEKSLKYLIKIADFEDVLRNKLHPKIEMLLGEDAEPKKLADEIVKFVSHLESAQQKIKNSREGEIVEPDYDMVQPTYRAPGLEKIERRIKSSILQRVITLLDQFNLDSSTTCKKMHENDYNLSSPAIQIAQEISHHIGLTPKNEQIQNWMNLSKQITL